ncbi:NAD-dependent epimerase/dehydratase family protein [Streptomyces sp. NPDC059740]|uniref:NAD-dependent epimerase/dehydratase family protein n=1 Tax=Streptomyces sp. NPDC059740 TaxID=3346926 RepID=UPI003648644C
MSSRIAVVVGATGQIGRATVRTLVADGWRVRAVSRRGADLSEWPEAVEPLSADREDDAGLAAAVGDGCEVLVDCVAYGESHARQLAALADRIGSAVVISSAAVYEDEQGRGFMTQDQPDGAPQYPVPLPESHRTVAPGDGDYARKKVALEQLLLAEGERLPVTLLRAGAVHGPHSPYPRELYFVKRVLDGRRVRLLAWGGDSRFHPVHVDNLAELVRLAAARPGSRVLNAGDPQVPTVAEISAAVDAAMGAPASEIVAVPEPGAAGGVGLTPWSLPTPLVLDMGAAERELGYRPVTGYAESLPATVEYVRERLAHGTWQDVFPLAARAHAGEPVFDYEAEDRWLAAHRG